MNEVHISRLNRIRTTFQRKSRTNASTAKPVYIFSSALQRVFHAITRKPFTKEKRLHCGTWECTNVYRVHAPKTHYKKLNIPSQGGIPRRTAICVTGYGRFLNFFSDPCIPIRVVRTLVPHSSGNSEVDTDKRTHCMGDAGQESGFNFIFIKIYTQKDTSFSLFFIFIYFISFHFCKKRVQTQKLSLTFVDLRWLSFDFRWLSLTSIDCRLLSLTFVDCRRLLLTFVDLR